MNEADPVPPGGAWDQALAGLATGSPEQLLPGACNSPAPPTPGTLIHHLKSEGRLSGAVWA